MVNLNSPLPAVQKRHRSSQFIGPSLCHGSQVSLRHCTSLPADLVNDFLISGFIVFDTISVCHVARVPPLGPIEPNSVRLVKNKGGT